MSTLPLSELARPHRTGLKPIRRPTTVRKPVTTPPPPAQETRAPALGHQPALDGLRGIAVLAVIGLHAGLLPGGGAGVDVFFTLSGFLITCLLFEERAATGTVRLGQFYMRRLLRLMPALVCLLVVHAIYCGIFYEGWERKAGLTGGMISLSYLSNWSRAFKWLPLAGLSHTWSLAIEEQFYLLWPVLLLGILALARSPRRALVAVLALAVLFAGHRARLMYQGAPLHRLYNGLDTRADALLIGCSAALMYQAFPIRRGARAAWCLSLAAGLCFLLLLGYFVVGDTCEAPGLYYGGYSLLALGSALVILGLTQAAPGLGILSALLRRPLLVWVGKLSYGLYLWHFFIFYVCEERFPQATRWLTLALAVCLTFAVAALSFYVVERPILRLKSRFAWKTT